MKTKLIIKLSVLLFALLLVVLFRQISGSGGFRKGINELFGVVPVQKINWCADHVVDVIWTSNEVPEALQKLEMSSLRDYYCELKTEAISGVDIDKLTWAPLAESSGATGVKTVLEWNKQYEVFKSGGMPFKSSSFSRELLDK